MVRYIKIAIALFLLALAANACKSSSCGCDSYGNVPSGYNQAESLA
ncbi:MAG: hypothetical protein WCU80_03780 [Paludibacteraceae bacterium]|nr:hypothetical protein [Prevotellaceae bacterium]